MIIDTHAHLTWDSFDKDLDEVEERAAQAGVLTVINVGADLESSKKAQKLECKKLKCFSTIGIHPEEALRFASLTQGKPPDIDESIHQNIGKLEQICQSDPKKVAAVGECGLDYYFKTEFSYVTLPGDIKNWQIKLFQAQIGLANKLNLPLIIHCRDAWADIFNFNYQGLVGVFHSFTSNLEDANKALNMGFYLSFSGMITYPKNDVLREVVKQIPLDRILVETDCPFLPPQPYRGQRNEPSFVVEVVKMIAQIKNISAEEVATQTSQNAITLFRLN